MIKSYKDLRSEGLTQKEIDELIKKKKLYKLDKGFYSDKKDTDIVELISTKYPNAVITFESALHFYFKDYKTLMSYIFCFRLFIIML